MTTENERQAAGNSADSANRADSANEDGVSASGGSGKLLLLVLVLLGGSIAFQKFFPQGDSVDMSGPPVPLPPLMVEGWLNTSAGEEPTNESLAGKLVVIDAWATWCAPCRAAMPNLAETHGRWVDRGVAFLGMTSEKGDKIEAIQSYADSVPGFDWPIAYGSREVWDALGIKSIPTLVLFNQEGVRVWQGHSLESLEAELEKRVL